MIMLIQSHKVRKHKVEMSLIKYNKYASHSYFSSCICFGAHIFEKLGKIQLFLSRFCLVSSPEMRYINMKDEVNTSSVLFSGKKNVITQHISLKTFTHISTVHSECSSLFTCVIVFMLNYS